MSDPTKATLVSIIAKQDFETVLEVFIISTPMNSANKQVIIDIHLDTHRRNEEEEYREYIVAETDEILLY